MVTLSIYKEIQPTYGEWLPILAELGFQKQIIELPAIAGVKRPQYRLENLNHKSLIWLPLRSDNEPVVKADFAAYSYQLYMQGIIEDMQDMAKMIERNRLNSTLQQGN